MESNEPLLPIIDCSILEVYRKYKETLVQENGKVSILVKLYEEEYAKQVRQ